MRTFMVTLMTTLLAAASVAVAGPARAEALYEFVSHCRGEQLGRCYDSIGERLNSLNARTRKRICLPQSYGGITLEDGVIPVSLLEHVRIKLAAACFGEAGADVDEVMADIVNGIYPCAAHG